MRAAAALRKRSKSLRLPTFRMLRTSLLERGAQVGGIPEVRVEVGSGMKFLGQPPLYTRAPSETSGTLVISSPNDRFSICRTPHRPARLSEIPCIRRKFCEPVRTYRPGRLSSSIFTFKCRKRAGAILYLVDDKGFRIITQKAARAVFRLFGSGRQVQGNVSVVGKHAAHQRGFPDLASTGQNDGWKLTGKSGEGFFVFSCNPHADILQRYC